MTMAVPAITATQWLANFSAALQRRDVVAAAALFLEDCYWRDPSGTRCWLRREYHEASYDRQIEIRASSALPLPKNVGGQDQQGGAARAVRRGLEAGCAYT
jgi:hypothetical protein